VLTGELFRRWLAQPNLIYEMFQTEANKKIDADYWPGAHLQQENRFKLKLEDPEKTNRLLKSFSSPEFKPGDLFSSTAWIDFDNAGRPYLSDKTREMIKEKCTVFAEPELRDALKNIETMVAAINKFKSFGRERTGRDVSLSDFPGLKMNGDELQTDVSGFIRAFYFENDPDYQLNKTGFVTGASYHGGRKSPKIPAGFELSESD